MAWGGGKRPRRWHDGACPCPKLRSAKPFLGRQRPAQSLPWGIRPPPSSPSLFPSPISTSSLLPHRARRRTWIILAPQVCHDDNFIGYCKSVCPSSSGSRTKSRLRILGRASHACVIKVSQEAGRIVVRAWKAWYWREWTGMNANGWNRDGAPSGVSGETVSAFALPGAPFPGFLGSRVNPDLKPGPDENAETQEARGGGGVRILHVLHALHGESGVGGGALSDHAVRAIPPASRRPLS